VEVVLDCCEYSSIPPDAKFPIADNATGEAGFSGQAGQQQNTLPAYPYAQGSSVEGECLIGSSPWYQPRDPLIP
jgi:hypothetical protein